MKRKKIKLANGRIYTIKDWDDLWVNAKNQNGVEGEKTIKKNSYPRFIFLPDRANDNKVIPYLIQREKNKRYYPKYIYVEKIGQSTREIRVKFLIDEQQQSSIYKTTTTTQKKARQIMATFDQLKAKGLASLLLWYGIRDKALNNNNDDAPVKLVQHQKFSGTPLLKHIKKHPSPMDVLDFAEQCCQIMDEYHQQGFFINDFKPDNLLVKSGKVHLIDYDAISQKEAIADDNIRIITQLFCRKLESGLYEPPSKSSDIYALGVTINSMIATKKLSKSLNSLSFLSSLLATKEIDQNLSTEQALQWFSILKQSPILAKNLAHYYAHTNKITAIEKIKALLDFYKDNKQHISDFYLDAIGCLFRHFPDQCTQKNWERIVNNPKETVFVLSSQQYLRYKFTKKAGQKVVKDTVKKFFDNDSISIETAISTIVDNKHCKSGKGAKTRRHLFTQDVEQVGGDIYKLKFVTYFPAFNAEYEQLDIFKKAVILTAIRYLDSPRAGNHGKQAVHKMVKQLLAPSKIERMQQTQDNNRPEKTSSQALCEADKKAIKMCCKSTGFFAFRSRKDKIGSRAQVFEKYLNPEKSGFGTSRI